MNDSFLDTNILIYCYTSTEPDKGEKARAIANTTAVISLQVIHEFVNVLQKKFRQDSGEILKAVEELKQTFSIHQNSLETAINAVEISKRYQYSFFDSLTIAAALEAGCETLYSEDLHHGQVIDKRLKIINPFR